MKESQRDRELFNLEDKYVKKQLDSMKGLIRASQIIEDFLEDHPETGLNLTVGSPKGEEFQVVVSEVVPKMLLGIAYEYFKLLKDVGMENMAQLAADELRLKRKPNK